MCKKAFATGFLAIVVRRINSQTEKSASAILDILNYTVPLNLNFKV
jgi:hypothetical protein